MANARTHREIVGTFDSPEHLEAAVAALASAGWDRAEMSLLGPKNILAPDKDYVPESEVVADNPDANRTAVVDEDDMRQGRALTAGMAGTIGAFVAAGATILTGGTVLAAIIGAAALGGGAAAAVEALGHKAEGDHQKFQDRQIDRGGIVLWAMLDGPHSENEARAILQRHGATDIHVHEIEGESVRERLQRRKANEAIDTASKDSFPASDPPSWISRRTPTDPLVQATEFDKPKRSAG